MVDDRTLLIDCGFLGYQSLYSLGELSHDNMRTGVIYGFLSRVLDLGHKFQTNDIVFCWDSKHSWRKKQFPGYKNRPRTEGQEEERRIMATQLKMLRRKILPKIGFRNNLIQAGLESDDMIAAVALGKLGDFMIISSDQDLYQLIRNNVRFYNPVKRKVLTRKRFLKEYGIEPRAWADMKMIAGCKSDTVPGVKGVGEQTALKYLRGELKSGSKRYKDINDFFSMRDMIDERPVQLNQRLIKLPHEKTQEPELTANNFHMGRLKKVFEKLGFMSFLDERVLVRWQDLFEANFDESPVRKRIKKRRRC